MRKVRGEIHAAQKRAGLKPQTGTDRSDTPILSFAIGTLAASGLIRFATSRIGMRVLGKWAPAILLLGIYKQLRAPKWRSDGTRTGC